MFSFYLTIFLGSDPDILVEKKIKEVKKGKDENFDFLDIEKNSQDGFVLGTMAIMAATPTFESDLPDLGSKSNASNVQLVKDNTTINLQSVAIDKLEISSTDGTTIVEKDNEISPCVVCHKKFKSKSCMNKHLRSVHAGLSDLFNYYFCMPLSII